jgi:3'(2'), 5'-bisphosphate nucleotidase
MDDARRDRRLKFYALRDNLSECDNGLTKRVRSDDSVATEAAAEASSLLQDLRARMGAYSTAGLRSAGDRESNDLILRVLRSHRPRDPILSEESLDGLDRVGSRRVWIVDPLDGTREFGERGRVDFAVHVALVIDGQPASGAVALPAEDVIFSTDGDPPQRESLCPGAGRPLRIIVSRTRPPEVAFLIARRMDAEIIRMGSAGAKAMAVLSGKADAYIHVGKLHEWDVAAPAAVLKQRGLHVSRLDGAPLRFNQRDPSLSNVLMCRMDIAHEMLGALATADR